MRNEKERPFIFICFSLTVPGADVIISIIMYIYSTLWLNGRHFLVVYLHLQWEKNQHH